MNNLKELVESVGTRFDEIAQVHNAVNFKQECFFALTALNGNTFAKGVALKNQNSLLAAILNVAAIGLTLNPALRYGYLVPRDGKICLDISYGGLIKLATDIGSIDWVQSELVREKDDFKINGIGAKPEHSFDFFSNRGEIKGVYCVAKIAHSDDYLTTVMSIEECFAIRDRTAAYKSFVAGKTKSCPWSTDEGEMMKKTVIKRASKLWPKSERLGMAIENLNEHEGIDFKKEREIVPNQNAIRIENGLNALEFETEESEGKDEQTNNNM